MRITWTKAQKSHDDPWIGAATIKSLRAWMKISEADHARVYDENDITIVAIAHAPDEVALTLVTKLGRHHLNAINTMVLPRGARTKSRLTKELAIQLPVMRVSTWCAKCGIAYVANGDVSLKDELVPHKCPLCAGLDQVGWFFTQIFAWSEEVWEKYKRTAYPAEAK